MRSNKQNIIELLNVLLKNRLTTINQYFLHARILKHWGEVELADREYKASIDAMRHADLLVNHLLSLGGEPCLQELDRLTIGKTTADMLHNDLVLAESAQRHIRAMLELCKKGGAAETIALLQKISGSQTESMDGMRAKIA